MTFPIKEVPSSNSHHFFALQSQLCLVPLFLLLQPPVLLIMVYIEKNAEITEEPRQTSDSAEKINRAPVSSESESERGEKQIEIERGGGGGGGWRRKQ